MRHPELKTLLWGKHLLGLLGVCGAGLLHVEPTPRVAQPMPLWFRRVVAVMTLVGLIGAIRFFDAAMRAASQVAAVAAGEVPELDSSALGTADHTWKASRFGLGLETAVVLPAARDADTLRFRGVPETAGVVPEPALRRTGRPAQRKETAREAREHRFQLIQVTAYTSASAETDSTPSVTASNTTPAAGTIALSRDLLRTFTPNAPFDFGDKVLIPGVGVFEASDTMHERWTRKADIWFSSLAAARAWGRRTVFITRVDRNAPTIARRVS